MQSPAAPAHPPPPSTSPADTNQPVSDSELLGRHIAADPVAFARLAERYRNLVYSTALRQTHNVALAEDVAQTVFLLLHRKASSLRSHSSLAGWLFRTTIFC